MKKSTFRPQFETLEHRQMMIGSPWTAIPESVNTSAQADIAEVQQVEDSKSPSANVSGQTKSLSDLVPEIGLSTDGLLWVDGTDLLDEVRIECSEENSELVRVSVKSTLDLGRFFNLSDAQRIAVTTKSGNDNIENMTSIIDEIFAGDGDDVVAGGLGASHLAGEGGRDSLYGRDGMDHIEGDVTDTIEGGADEDRLEVKGTVVHDARRGLSAGVMVTTPSL